MGYLTLKNAIDYENTQEGWQIRVHIRIDALDQRNPKNKVALIKDCLKQVFGDDQVDSKIYQISNDADAEGYDGAISSIGKDRTQVGKEICIYLPDTRATQLSSQQYKQKLLNLWHLLQTKNIPLLHFNPPGDKSITISDSKLPSPFSFTSSNPERKEWLDKHGILFKEFEPNGKHPILDVNFSIDDLTQRKISLAQPLAQSSAFLIKHRKEALHSINQQLQTIKNQGSYSTLLHDDNQTKALLKLLVKKYQDAMDNCTTMDERAKTQLQRHSDLEANQAYQTLVSAYPHESNGEFSDNPLIGEIKARINNELTAQRIDEIVDALRTEYQNKTDEIQNDFAEHNIQYVGYNIQELIQKNPAAMQSVFRQQALINQETLKNELMGNGSYATQIALLKSYKAERNEKTENQYFSKLRFLSRPFGAWSKNEKFSAVDALIEVFNERATGNPSTLDSKHLGPLQQGNLGRLIKTLEINLNGALKITESSSLKSSLSLTQG